jgi:hypothetical protein
MASAAASAKWTCPSAPTANTPSITQQWKWTWAFNALPKRCTKLTAPSRPRAQPLHWRSRAWMTRKRMRTALSASGSRTFSTVSTGLIFGYCQGVIPYQI